MVFDPETHRELARLPPRMSPGGTPSATGGPGLPLYSEDLPERGEDAIGGGRGEGNGDGRGDSQEELTCCIVFPATYASIARWPPSDAAKSGVIVFAG